MFRDGAVNNNDDDDDGVSNVLISTGGRHRARGHRGHQTLSYLWDQGFSFELS